jgi:tetratricopeptide (TPR) repeat protein
MGRRLAFCLSIILTLGAVSSPKAQIAASQNTNPSSVSGYVFGTQKSGVGNLLIEIMNEYNRVIGRTRTDTSGRYFFRGLSSGRYTVRVLTMASEYEEQTQEIEIAGINAVGQQIPDNIQKDFYLSLRKTGSRAPAAPGTLFVESVPEDAKKLFDQALIDLNEKRTETGIENLRRALKIYPNYFAASERLGLEYLYKDDYADARDAFATATVVNARSFNSWYFLAYTSFGLERNAETVEAADRALQLVPNSVPTLLLRGLAQRKLKHYDEAERSLTRAKGFDEGKTPDLYWNLALLYAHNLKRYKDAANELETYLRSDPSIPNKDEVRKLIKQFNEMR